MKPQYHIASSALVSGILYLFFKSWSMALFCFFSGVLIDVDHIYDYIKRYGLPLKARDIYNASYNNDITRWTIVLHSWELLFLMFIIAWITNWNLWITAVLIGFSHHIVMDTFNNKVTIQTYSFIWRWKKNFIIK